jgi:hypothetical protein
VQHQLTINDVLRFEIRNDPGSGEIRKPAGVPRAAVSHLSLIPDGYAEFATPTGIDASFVEVDLGHRVSRSGKKSWELCPACAFRVRAEVQATHFRVLVLQIRSAVCIRSAPRSRE